jgi:hypothetical protein
MFGMRVSDVFRLPLAALLVVALMTSVAFARPPACDFAPVKQQIDNVLDKDPAKFATFRKEVSEGADPIAMMEQLVAEDIRKMLGICRYEVDQYLAKRGFPAFH